MRSRHLALFLCLSLVASHLLRAQDTPPLEARQVIIRAPMEEVARAALRLPDDAQLTGELWKWVAEGKAKVVSSLSSLMESGRETRVESGNYDIRPAERGYDEEKLVAIVEAEMSTFVGSKFEVATNTQFVPEGQIAWAFHYSPRDPLMVKWPITWPPRAKPGVGWNEDPDYFEEAFYTRLPHQPGVTHILAILPRADGLEPDAPPKPEVDVVLAEIKPLDKPTPTLPGKPTQSAATAQMLVMGFGLKDEDALQLLEKRAPADDALLLEQLMRLTEEKKAILRVLCTSKGQSQARVSASSARNHTVATSVHTMPTTWELVPVGTSLEFEYLFPGKVSFAFTRHPSLPQRVEWCCAMDAPEMVMWQPAFTSQLLRGTRRFSKSDTTLLGVMRTPDCLAEAKSLTKGETLLLMARLTEDQGSEPQDAGEKLPRIELESIIFEIPSEEAGRYEKTFTGTEDDANYAALRARLTTGKVSLASHLVLQDGETSMTRGVPHAAEGQVIHKYGGRFMPTDIKTHPCGSIWKAEAFYQASDSPFSNAPEVLLEHTLTLDVALPKEPTLKQVLAYEPEYPSMFLPAEPFVVKWDEDVTLAPGKARCLGVRKPPVGDGSRVLVAFVKARILDAGP